jgi:hypothetical protein
MARPRKVPLEGATKTVTHAEVSEAERAGAAEFDAINLAEIAEAFKKANPDKWEAIRLCPTQHGIEEMIACLRS